MKPPVVSIGETVESPVDSRLDRAAKFRKHCPRPTSCYFRRTPERPVSGFLAGILRPGENVRDIGGKLNGKGGEHGHQRT